MIKLSDFVFKFITKEKVGHVFLLSGGGCMHLVDSLGRNRDLEYIACQHEQAASIAADAYAQYTNNLGVALVTTGPGSTNAITGVAAAWVESIPLLIISGQVKRSDIAGPNGPRVLGFQEINTISLIKSITKYAITIMEPNEIRYHLEKAIYLAKSGRPGPVWIDIPLDVQATKINENKLKKFIPPTDNKTEKKEIIRQVEKTIKLINRSERPVIIAGYGIKIDKAENNFLRLVEKLKIPVLTTWKAIDLMPDTHKFFFGRPGAIGQRGANFIQQNADLLISIGARLDFGQIGYSYQNFARGAKKVIIDIDKAELKKFKFDAYLPICARAEEFIKEMTKQIGKIKNNDFAPWLKKSREWKNKYPVVLAEYYKKKDYVSTYSLVNELAAQLTNKDLIVLGSSGACSDITMQAFKVKKGERIINMPGFGAMGFGLPSTVGACLASGKKRTICINGDGGFQLNIQELATVNYLNLPIKYFILNNKGYGSIRTTQRNYFSGFYVASGPESGVDLPDYTKVAQAYGIKSMKIIKQAGLENKIYKVLKMTGPVICEVMIDPNEPTSPKLTSQVKKDGSIISKPMEDLWPFLDRDEFINNMIVKPLDE